MLKIEKKDLLLFMAQVAVWTVVLFAMPLATLFTTQDMAATKTSFFVGWRMFRSPLVVYFVNFYILGPYLFFRRRYWTFVLSNLVLILGLNFQFFQLWLQRDNIPNRPPMTTEMWIGIFSGFLMFLLFCAIMASIAIGVRHIIRTRKIKQQLKDEKAKHVEAELAWLKNQINPHFLFNTLNNISSLTQIDADAAQDAIAQLSDLLRYAMYKTNKKMVPIQGELEFMHNYINLMKLRCNDKTIVTTNFDVQQKIEVPPLLFVSLIENSFKHGVSSSRPSSIDIRLQLNGEDMVFECSNTNYPKNDADRSGSGIGIENTRRRLDLIYHNRYDWEQSLKDDIYNVRITIHL